MTRAARSKNTPPPRRGGSLEPWKNRNRLPQRGAPAGARPLRQPVPLEQVAKEVLRTDGLNLAAQPVERVAMNTREKPPIAEFVFRLPRTEAAATHDSVGFELRRRSRDLPWFQGQTRGQPDRREGADDLRVPAHVRQHSVGARRPRSPGTGGEPKRPRTRPDPQ